MRGTTNASCKMVNEVEKISIILQTNQSSHTDLNGVKFTVSYDSNLEEYTWNGNTITVEVPALIEYTIKFGDVANYASPTDLTYIAQGGNSRSITAKYQTEIVSVTLSADNGASVNGQIVTINGMEHTWNGTVIQQKIPFGMYYNVVANEKSGYSAPSTKLIQASQSSRDLSMVYVASAVGVFIQDIYGNLYTEDEWDGTQIANGIAVISDACQFVVAKDYVLYASSWSTTNTLVKDIATTTESSEALSDMDGEGNTDKIIAQLGDSAELANACRSSIFPSGQRGYLLASGELNVFEENIDKIKELLNLIN